MKALHRLVGNTPKRGFGAGLFSPGFPGGFAILANTDIRLPMTNVPGERNPLMGGPVEAYRSFEVQPLRYGLIAAFQSVKINIEGSRPSSYTDTVIPEGEEVRENVTAGPGIRSILRFNGFISKDAFLNLSKNSLDVTEWTCIDERVLDEYALPAAVTPEMHRSLLLHYWRAATVQRFGPWDARTGQCLYEAHPVMREFLPMRYTVVMCLGPDGDCGRIIDGARGFLWNAVLRLLPGAVSNIASMSAAAPVRFVSSIYRNTALAVVYPEQHDSIKFDFRTGAGLEITPEEDAFIRKIMRGERPALLSDLVRRYAERTGITDENDMTFLADYDVYWQLERLGWEDLPLLERIKSWFALDRYLEDRHGLSWEQVKAVCAAVDRDVLARLSAESGAMTAALAPQEEERRNRANDMMLTFLWRKALSADDQQYRLIASLLTAYHTPQAEHFFTENLLAASIEGDREEERAAELARDILNANFMTESPFSPQQIAMLGDGKLMALCQAHPRVRQALCAYLQEEGRRNPGNMLSMLPVTVQLLPRDEVMERLFTHLRQEPSLPPQNAWAWLRAGMSGLSLDSAAHAAYADYLVAAFQGHLRELDQLCAMGCAVNADTGRGLCGMLQTAARQGILLSSGQMGLLMGEHPRVSLYPLCGQKRDAAQAFWNYLIAVTMEREVSQEDLGPWLWQMYEAGGKCLKDTAPMDTVSDKMEDLFIRYVTRRGEPLLAVPGEESFARLQRLAGPKRRPAFERYGGQLLGMYEAILEKGDDDQRQGAARQLRTLLPGFARTEGYPKITELEQRFACDKLKDSWKRYEYWQGVDLLKEDLKRSGLDQTALLTPEVQQAGQARLDADLSLMTAYPHFFSKYNEYKNRPGFPPRAGEEGFGRLCFDRMQAHFISRFDNQVAQCGSLMELSQLQSYAETVMRASAQTDKTDGGRCIRAVRSVQQTLDSLTNYDDVAAVLNKAMACAQILSDGNVVSCACYRPTLELMQNYYLVARRDEMSARPFHIRLAVGLVCNISPERKAIRWGDVIAQLCPGWEGMMRSPFSSHDVQLFQVIRYMFSTLAGQREADGTPTLRWAKSLAHFLNTDGTFEAYTQKVRKEKRALKQFLPYQLDPANLSQEAQAVKMWLGADQR